MDWRGGDGPRIGFPCTLAAYHHANSVRELVERVDRTAAIDDGGVIRLRMGAPATLELDS